MTNIDQINLEAIKTANEMVSQGCTPAHLEEQGADLWASDYEALAETLGRPTTAEDRAHYRDLVFAIVAL